MCQEVESRLPVQKQEDGEGGVAKFKCMVCRSPVPRAGGGGWGATGTHAGKPSAPGRRKDRQESRKTKKLTMFGRLGAYQCVGVRRGPSDVLGQMRPVGAVQVRRGCLGPRPPPDPTWDRVVVGLQGPAFSNQPPGGRNG